MTSLRVALLDHGQEASPANDAAAKLRERGHDTVVISGRDTPLDALLEKRGFTVPLAHLPATFRQLTAGGFDIAHAFSPQDAYAALRWRRRTGKPVVFSCTEPPERAQLADRRLKLRFMRAALEESDAVIVHDERSREAAWRWLLLEPSLIPPGDAAALEDLYRRLLAPRK